jgi:hypothetical protein
VGGGCRGVIEISDWLKTNMEKESVEKKDEITRLNHLGNEGKMAHDPDDFERLVMEKIATMTKPADCGVIAKTTPVISFGDFTTSRIATLGINPSSAEFTSGGKLIVGEKKRLADEEFGSSSPLDIWFHCKHYFRNNPYWSWFKHLEELLNQVGASYEENACHLDLSPWATDPIFGKLTPRQQETLLHHDRELLNWQITESPIKTVLFNGATVYKTIQAAQNYHLQKVGELTYASGGQVRTSDLISGDGPKGESIFGWTVNLQALQATVEERAEVMAKLADWLKNECKIDLRA